LSEDWSHDVRETSSELKIRDFVCNKCVFIFLYGPNTFVFKP